MWGVIDEVFFWPTFNDLLYDDGKDLNMGRQWPDDAEHLKKCYSHWAWGLQRICAYANACVRDFGDDEAPGFKLSEEHCMKRVQIHAKVVAAGRKSTVTTVPTSALEPTIFGPTTTLPLAEQYRAGLLLPVPDQQQRKEQAGEPYWAGLLLPV